MIIFVMFIFILIKYILIFAGQVQKKTINKGYIFYLDLTCYNILLAIINFAIIIFIFILLLIFTLDKFNDII